MDPNLQGNAANQPTPAASINSSSTKGDAHRWIGASKDTILYKYIQSNKSTQDMIVAVTKQFKLPLAVRSTALLLYCRLHSYAKQKNGGIGNVDCPYTLGLICILMGCKFEDVHGNLAQLFMRIGCPEEEFPRLLEGEIESLETLEFTLAYPNLYMKLEAILMLCEEHGYKVATSWDAGCARLDGLLSSEKLSTHLGLGVNENGNAYPAKVYNAIAVAVLDQEEDLFEILNTHKIEFDLQLANTLRMSNNS